MNQYRKFLVALTAVAAQLVALGVATGTAAKIVTAVLAGIGALGVYAVPNENTTTQPGVAS